MTIIKAIQNLYLLEGRKVELVAGDKGLLTNSGYTQAAYDASRDKRNLPRQSVSLMTQLELEQFYGEDYWIPAGCELLPDGLDFCHFQWVVNHGVTGGLRTLKTAIHYRAQKGDLDGPLMAKDADLIAANSLYTTIERYLGIQSALYDHIEQHDPSQIVNFDGWENRIQRTRDIIAGLPLSV